MLLNREIPYGPEDHQYNNDPIPSAFWLILMHAGFPVRLSIMWEVVSKFKPLFDITGQIVFIFRGRIIERRLKFDEEKGRWKHYWRSRPIRVGGKSV